MLLNIRFKFISNTNERLIRSITYAIEIELQILQCVDIQLRIFLFS